MAERATQPFKRWRHDKALSLSLSLPKLDYTLTDMVISKLPYTVAFADELHADGIAYARTLFERVLVHSDKDYFDWIEEADGICNRAKVIPSADLRRSQKVRVLSKQGVGGTSFLCAPVNDDAPNSDSRSGAPD